MQDQSAIRQLADHHGSTTCALILAQHPTLTQALQPLPAKSTGSHPAKFPDSAQVREHSASHDSTAGSNAAKQALAAAQPRTQPEWTGLVTRREHAETGEEHFTAKLTKVANHLPGPNWLRTGIECL